MKYLITTLTLAASLHAAPVAVGPNGEGLNQPLFMAAVLPVQTGQSGKYLKTNGTVATWETVVGGGGDLTSGPVRSTAGASSIADAALTIAKTSGLQTELNAKVPTTRTVNSRPLTSDVVVTKGDVLLGNVDNTADVSKPVSSLTQAAITASHAPVLGSNFLCKQQQREYLWWGWQRIAAFTGEGCLRNFWLALGDNSSGQDVRNVRIRMTANGAATPQFGGAAGIRLEDLLGPGQLEIGLTYRTDRLVVHRNEIANYGAMLRVPVPYQNGLVVEMLNPSTITTSSLISGGVANTSAGNFFWAPSSQDDHISGDFEISARIAATTWTTGSPQTIIRKGGWDSFSYALKIAGTAQMVFDWTNAAGVTTSVVSGSIPGATNGVAEWVRVTMDVDNGSGGHTVKFWESADGVAWSQFGGTGTYAGIIAVVNQSLRGVEIGGSNNVLQYFTGVIHNVKVRQGIDGPLLVDFNPAPVPNSAVTWKDSLGREWQQAAVFGTDPVLLMWTMAEASTGPLILPQINSSNPWILNAAVADSPTLAIGAEQTLLNTSVPTHLLGIFHHCAPGVPGQFTYMEGDYRMFQNPSTTAFYRSSGQEDFFTGSWYYGEGVFARKNEGLTVRPSNAKASAYRFFDDMPYGPTGLKFTWTNGDPSILPTAATNSKAVILYYTAP